MKDETSTQEFGLLFKRFLDDIVNRVGAGIAALSSYFVPVVTLAMAVVFLGERPQPLQLAGGLVILAGVRIATLRPSEAAPLPEGAA